jgi:hypothetical protein
MSNFGICRACGAQILFVKMRSGKAMPCDTELKAFWQAEHGSQKIVTPAGEVVSAELTGDGEPSYGYTSHFATCPGSAKFRRK